MGDSQHRGRGRLGRRLGRRYADRADRRCDAALCRGRRQVTRDLARLALRTREQRRDPKPPDRKTPAHSSPGAPRVHRGEHERWPRKNAPRAETFLACCVLPLATAAERRATVSAACMISSARLTSVRSCSARTGSAPPTGTGGLRRTCAPVQLMALERESRSAARGLLAAWRRPRGTFSLVRDLFGRCPAYRPTRHHHRLLRSGVLGRPHVRRRSHRRLSRRSANATVPG